MNPSNQSTVTFFIIRGISDLPELQLPIFLLVLFIYLISLSGNMTILLLLCSDRRLHTPMYFFLCNLSILDMSSTTITLHKILVNFVTGDHGVSFFACMTQMYVFSSFACDGLYLLTAMSYDRYVAICNPLRYPVLMNHRVCALLATVCWTLGLTQMIPFLVFLSILSHYESNVINHFFCDILPLMKISDRGTSFLEIYTDCIGFFLWTGPFIFTFLSYVYIIKSILKIRTNSGRRKAFYTCSSHITVVSILYVTLGTQYLSPTSEDNLDSNKLFALLNAAAVPMLNPLIYSLKNKDVKSALRRRLR
ncbi:olfactory receptor 8A1-like [Pelobates fuscus]|uniref:olfactory receptor 8A1-like n=1 Tax=Pelobates fuscus TaxID=191477 RepID=UPI002FE43D88